MIQLDFLAVGPQRTATSWLYEVLKHHPSICFPRGVKETMYFDLRYHRGEAYYDSHFRHAQPSQIMGEIGPSYFHCVAATDRIAQHSPGCKIIINVRNPITRCHSLFRHHLSKGRLRNDFGDALKRMPEIIESGRYSQYAPRWEDRFGHENVLYLVQEDINQDPERVLITVRDFLGVEPMAMPAVAKNTVNSAAAPRNWLLAKVLSTCAGGLRSWRLHGIAEFGKKIGLVNFYQGGGSVDPLTSHHAAKLNALYDQDITWLEHRLSRNFKAWREIA